MKKTSNEIEEEFKAKLRALLAEYDAELTADDHWQGYAECGQDIRMTIYVPGIYEGENARDMAEINLGSYFYARA